LLLSESVECKCLAGSYKTRTNDSTFWLRCMLLFRKTEIEIVCQNAKQKL